MANVGVRQPAPVRARGAGVGGVALRAAPAVARQQGGRQVGRTGGAGQGGPAAGCSCGQSDGWSPEPRAAQRLLWPPAPCAATARLLPLPPCRLRISFLVNQPAGARSHTVLLTDVPGVAYGTLAARIDATLLRFLPAREPGGGGAGAQGQAGWQGPHRQLLKPTTLALHLPKRRCLAAGAKAWLAGAAWQGVHGVGSTLKLGAGWVAGQVAGKAADAHKQDVAGDGGAAGPSSFSIAAGRAAAPAAARVMEGAWEQVCGGERGLLAFRLLCRFAAAEVELSLRCRPLATLHAGGVPAGGGRRHPGRRGWPDAAGLWRQV